MNLTEQQFFALLRTGIWGTVPDESLFNGEVEWEEILKIAAMQTVSGPVFDGISLLPPDQQPPGALMRQFYATVVRVEQSHALLNDRLARVVAELRSIGIRPVLLKGQGAALNYPNPLRRQCGDIDLYIGGEDYRRACRWVVGQGMAPDSSVESHKHFHFDWEGVHIELHRIAEKLPGRSRDKKFQAWTRNHLEGVGPVNATIGQAEVLLPPVNFNALYIFNHAFHHFVSDGVGCRQLCDWVLYLHQYREQLDREQLKKDLETFGLTRVWQLFGCIAVHQLGLPEEEFPFYSDRYRRASEEIILGDILQLGNFGRYAKKWKTRPPGYLSGKLHNFRMKNRRALQLLPAVGGSAIHYYIYYLVIGIQAIVNDKFK